MQHVSGSHPSRATATRRVEAALSHSRWPVGAALLAGVLALPALWTGWLGDDHPHRAVLTGSPVARPFFPTAMSMFEFFDGDPQRTLGMIDRGVMPWWTVSKIKGPFWRPLTVATHWFDYRLWPQRPGLIHAHSLLWFAALVAAAGLFYRRILGPTWVAGLGTLLYAVDDTHAVPAAWIANRNIVIAAFFGLCCLLAHDRWRRRGGALAGLAGPVLLAASLLATEAGLSTVAYLAAYAIFLDRGSRRQRWASVLPYAVVVVAWRLAWMWLGHGVLHVGYYVNPAREPIRFVLAAVERMPILLLAQWASLPADVSLLLGGWLLWAFWLIAAAVTVIVGWLLWPLLRQSRQARFWAAGMLMSLLPICAPFPSDRLLLFVGLGAMGLLAEFLTNVLGRFYTGSDRSAPSPRRGRLVRAGAMCLVAIHLLIAPPAMLLRCCYPLGPTSLDPGHLYRVSLDRSIEHRHLCLISAPMPPFTGYMLLTRALAGQPVPLHLRLLAPMSGPLTVARPDSRTLAVRSTRGWGDKVLGELLRSEADPMTPGEMIRLSGLTIEASEVSPEKMPAEAVFRFAVPLEDPSWRWLHWSDGMLRPWAPPAVGQTVELPAAEVPWLHRL